MNAALDRICPSDEFQHVRNAILSNFTAFQSLIDRAEALQAADRLEAAASHAAVAAQAATHCHGGIFASPRLERLLLDLGQALLPRLPAHEVPVSPQRILHVCTATATIGGHARMMWRWIEADRERRHSVVITRQMSPDVPKPLAAAVAASGGHIIRLNRTFGGFGDWARRLRQLARMADLVVLHTHNHDILPVLAFSHRADVPPVVLLDHADHLFWVGVSVADVVAGLRRSGLDLAAGRRGVAPERLILLPTLLDMPCRTRDREDAKRALGLSSDQVVLLSVARAGKYGRDYADTHVPLLLDHPQAVLIVVGSGDRPDWAEAVRRTGGRIILHPERPDTSPFFQAADLYVDSFPFISTTSLLEAGSLGIPLVSRSPFGPGAAVLDVEVPGVTDTLIRAKSPEEYRRHLARLIDDPDHRTALGGATRRAIATTHAEAPWRRQLEAVYRRAGEVQRVGRAIPSPPEAPRCDELDCLVQEIFGWRSDVSELIRLNIKAMPPSHRASQWFDLLRGGSFTDIGMARAMKFLLPEWLVARLRAFA